VGLRRNIVGLDHFQVGSPLALSTRSSEYPRIYGRAATSQRSLDPELRSRTTWKMSREIVNTDRRVMSLVGNCKFNYFAAQMTTHEDA
jgi:hypothetical protein